MILSTVKLISKALHYGIQRDARHARQFGAEGLHSAAAPPGTSGPTGPGGKGRLSAAALSAAAVAGAAAGAFVGGAAAAAVFAPDSQPQGLPSGLTPEEVRNNLIFERNKPAVVSISITSRIAAEIKVKLDDDPSWHTARLVASDREADVPVLRLVGVPPEKLRRLQPATLGSSEGLFRVGQKVYTLGDPLGFEKSFTSGMLSGVNRNFSTAAWGLSRNMLQFDAMIAPGNSGGPLLDSSGHVIGMTTTVGYSTFRHGAYCQAAAFAVPIDMVKSLAGRMIPQQQQREQQREPQQQQQRRGLQKVSVAACA